MPVHVGVALFFTPGRADYLPAHFHWALAVTGASDWVAQPVRTMQLLPNNNRRAFETQDLTKVIDFTGVVHFLSTDAFTVESIEDWILESFPCSDSKWRLPGKYGPKEGWTCATWILQILVELQRKKVWVNRWPVEVMYVRVLNLGADMQDVKETHRRPATNRVPVLEFQSGAEF
ncbi:hypothetical protein BDZ89DRAFT_226880 [Hymenopellis radicata]|nr:hypothetical protein BDZ89DRAFT_226880 [Hymenopellis radicata]